MNSFNQDSIGYWIPKDPGAVLDYVMNWSDWLQAAETILTSVWTVTAGLTKTIESSTANTTTVWLSSGVVGQTYTVTNHITTSLNRQEERSFRIKVQNR